MSVTPDPEPEQDRKQAEKEYLRRTGGRRWEEFKPFVPPGARAGEESAYLILDFAVLLLTLRPSPSDLILDLGAGSCWCSEWLERLNVRAVSVDLSHDMLTIGKARLSQANGSRLVAGDMEHLPFADASFQKAFCLNAFHHVPDTSKALQEIARVLTPDGIVLFAEPGKGHAEKPASVAAMRDCGVLERDILIADFLDACIRAGFADARLQPVSHVVPGFVLKKTEWDSWRAMARSKRPVRAVYKIWRAVLEVFGLGKKSVLFEEAFAIRLIRLLEPLVELHPVVTAYKSPLTRIEPESDLADLVLLEAPESIRHDEWPRMRIRARNRGTRDWPAPEKVEPGCVRVGVQLLDKDLALLNRDYHRQRLPRPVRPGETVEVAIEMPPPAEAGVYQLKIDLVREDVAWFEIGGSSVIFHRITVGRAPARGMEQ
jgi:ubiquinone/menaquinone biosynthesis C-methylase UbiE